MLAAVRTPPAPAPASPCRPARLRERAAAVSAAGPGGPGADEPAAGDPHAGRFPYDEAVAGLPEGPRLRRHPRHRRRRDPLRPRARRGAVAVANFVGLARGLRPFQDASPTAPGTPRPTTTASVHRVRARRIHPDRTPRRARGARLSSFRTRCRAGHVFDRRGLLALANTGEPHTQRRRVLHHDRAAAQLKGKHTIFGVCDAEERRPRAGAPHPRRRRASHLGSKVTIRREDPRSSSQLERGFAGRGARCGKTAPVYGPTTMSAICTSRSYPSRALCCRLRPRRRQTRRRQGRPPRPRPR